MLSLQNKSGYKILTYSLTKENNKKAQSLKLNSTPDLVKSSIQKIGKYALNIPSRIRAEVGKYASCYVTQAARKRYNSKYPKYEIKQSPVNNCE